jgi:hypothetical protein
MQNEYKKLSTSHSQRPNKSENGIDNFFCYFFNADNNEKSQSKLDHAKNNPVKSFFKLL